MIPMEPVHDQEIMDRAQKLYALRPAVEKIADAVCEKGFTNILFTSAGGSLASLSPFCEMLKYKTTIPSFTEIPAELVTIGNPEITDQTLAVMTSKSGDTIETLNAAKWLKERHVTIVSFCGEENSPIAQESTHSICYREAEPHDLIPIFFIGKIMKNRGFFDDYESFADELQNLGKIWTTSLREAEPVAQEYAAYFDPVDKDFQMWVGSGMTWGQTYNMAMCVLEECQWLRTQSVHAADFFHGALEIVERNVLVCVSMGEGPTRPLDQRVVRFASRHTNQLVVFDTRTLSVPGVEEKYRWMLSPVLLLAMFERTFRYLADVRKHDMEIRRYYRRLSY